MLQKLETKHGPRVEVAANAQSLLDQSNGVSQIASIDEVVFDYVAMVDGDGFGIENKDGSERYRKTIILR